MRCWTTSWWNIWWLSQVQALLNKCPGCRQCGLRSMLTRNSLVIICHNVLFSDICSFILNWTCIMLCAMLIFDKKSEKFWYFQLPICLQLVYNKCFVILAWNGMVTIRHKQTVRPGPVFSLAWSELMLCSANHSAGYLINLTCDSLSIVWDYSEQDTENGPTALAFQ